MARNYGGDLARTMYADSILDTHKRELHRKDVRIRNMRAEIRRLQDENDELKKAVIGLELELEDMAADRIEMINAWRAELDAEAELD